jgi:hypothetical protein
VAVELVDCYDALFPASGKETQGTDVPVADVMVDICLSLMSRYTLFSSSLSPTSFCLSYGQCRERERERERERG